MCRGVVLHAARAGRAACTLLACKQLILYAPECTGWGAHADGCADW